MLRVYILFLVNRMKCLGSFPDFFADIIKLILDPPQIDFNLALQAYFSICLAPNQTSLHKHAFYLFSSAYEHLYLIGCSPCLPHLSTQILCVFQSQLKSLLFETILNTQLTQRFIHVNSELTICKYAVLI